MVATVVLAVTTNTTRRHGRGRHRQLRNTTTRHIDLRHFARFGRSTKTECMPNAPDVTEMVEAIMQHMPSEPPNRLLVAIEGDSDIPLLVF